METNENVDLEEILNSDENVILEEILDSAKRRPVGEKIRSLREFRGLTQSALAEKAKQNEAIIAKCEQMEYDRISQINADDKILLDMIAKGLGENGVYALFKPDSIIAVDESELDYESELDNIGEFYIIKQDIVEILTKVEKHTSEKINKQKILVMKFFHYHSIYEAIINNNVKLNIFNSFKSLTNAEKLQIFDYINELKTDATIYKIQNTFYMQDMHMNFNNNKFFLDKYEEFAIVCKEKVEKPTMFNVLKKVTEEVIDLIYDDYKKLLEVNKIKDNIDKVITLDEDDLSLLCLMEYCNDMQINIIGILTNGLHKE